MRLFAPAKPPAAAHEDAGAPAASGVPGAQGPAPRRRSPGSVVARLLAHVAFLLISVGCLIAYEHFRAAGQSGASLASLIVGAILGFAPARDVVRIVFRIEGRALHLAHGIGGLALLGLPVVGVVSGPPVLTHAALAPFAIMGAAQAVMHQGHPRNAKQAAALRTFAASLPEVARFTSASSLASPANAQRAIAVLSDILAKAQALGQTELEADPGFQSALRQVSTRFGAGLGLDAVSLVLKRLAAMPGTAGAVPALRSQLDSARRAIEGARSR